MALPELPAMQKEQLTLQPALLRMLNTLCITPLAISFQVLEFPALLSPSCFQSHFQRLNVPSLFPARFLSLEEQPSPWRHRE